LPSEGAKPQEYFQYFEDFVTEETSKVAQRWLEKMKNLLNEALGQHREPRSSRRLPEQRGIAGGSTIVPEIDQASESKIGGNTARET